MATAAVVLGFVTAGLTALVTSLVLLIASTDSTDPAVVCLGLGLPCAVGLAAGATRLLRRRSHAVLFYSAVAAVAVLVLPVLVAVSTEPRGRALAAAVFMLVACPLPVLTAIFSTLPRVEGWAAAGRP